MVLPVLLGLGLKGAMVAVAGWALARSGVTWWVMLRGQGPLWEGRLLRSQLAYGLPFGAAMAFALPPQYAHQFVVASVVPPAAFALYAAGCLKLPLVDLLYTPTSEVLMVQLGELARDHRAPEAVHAFREAAARLGYVFLPLAGFLFAVAPLLLSTLFGPRFLPATPIFRVGLVGIILATLPMDGVLRATRHTRHIFLSALVKCAVALPLVWLGLRAFGMVGAMGAWALTEVVGKAMLFWKVPAALSPPGARLRARDVLPGMALARAALASAAGAAGVLALGALVAPHREQLPSGEGVRARRRGARLPVRHPGDAAAQRVARGGAPRRGAAPRGARGHGLRWERRRRMGLDAMAMYRLARGLRLRGVPLLPEALAVATRHLFSSHLPPEADIGEGTRLGYGGMGVVIHRDAVIGRHCMVAQGVTIDAGSRGAPRIGDHVRIGAGVFVSGDITIGDFAVLGANAVVLEDVPRASIVAGIPARVLRTDPSLERCARCEAGNRGVRGRYEC
jgi:serine acetyltransferase